MSDYQSYRKERLKFYLKAIDVLRKDNPNLALDDLYSDAVKEAELMWSHFSESLADIHTIEWLRRNEEAGNPPPSDYEIYKDSLSRRPK